MKYTDKESEQIKDILENFANDYMYYHQMENPEAFLDDCLELVTRRIIDIINKDN